MSYHQSIAILIVVKPTVAHIQSKHGIGYQRFALDSFAALNNVILDAAMRTRTSPKAGTRTLGRGSLPRIREAIAKRETVTIYPQKARSAFVPKSYGWPAFVMRATVIPSAGCVYVLFWWADAKRKNGEGERVSIPDVGQLAHARNVIADILRHSRGKIAA